ncbi:MAG TPA: hypothetical protein VF189_02135 [Patescibacteria group bacterium]
MRKLILLVSFFLITPALLAFSLALLSVSSNHPLASVLGIKSEDVQSVAYAALPSVQNVMDASASLQDKRVGDLQSFFTTYHSPLLLYSQEIVTKADEYGIDYRLLPAIAMQESGLCKKALSKAPYNCWGFGIYGKKITSFSSYDEAIDTITRYFANKKENGVSTLEEIGKIYNPGNTNNWIENVTTIIGQI